MATIINESVLMSKNRLTKNLSRIASASDRTKAKIQTMQSKRSFSYLHTLRVLPLWFIQFFYLSFVFCHSFLHFL